VPGHTTGLNDPGANFLCLASQNSEAVTTGVATAIALFAWSNKPPTVAQPQEGPTHAENFAAPAWHCLTAPTRVGAVAVKQCPSADVSFRPP
jgi:hypothetical protein